MKTIDLKDYPFLEKYVDMLTSGETDEICFTEDNNPVAYMTLTPEYIREMSENDNNK